MTVPGVDPVPGADPVAGVSAGASAVRFGFSRTRRALCIYLIVNGVVCSIAGIAAIAGAYADVPRLEGLEVLGVGAAMAALAVYLLRAYVIADASGIRARALRRRVIPAADIVDVTVRTVRHIAYYPTPIAPYVVRRRGQDIAFVKLAALERLASPSAQALLEDQARQLLEAARSGRPSTTANRAS